MSYPAHSHAARYTTIATYLLVDSSTDETAIAPGGQLDHLDFKIECAASKEQGLKTRCAVVVMFSNTNIKIERGGRHARPFL
ncbi:MAG: hypothetical protein H0W99_05180 [Acidobacteria bacterium]|nr:hypothetical protein [Acidobacteriota bacterium]